MLNIFAVRFTIERTVGGGYVATCSELAARLEASALPELEAKMSRLARSLVEEPGVEPPSVLVHRVFPRTRALA